MLGIVKIEWLSEMPRTLFGPWVLFVDNANKSHYFCLQCCIPNCKRSSAIDFMPRNEVSPEERIFGALSFLLPSLYFLKHHLFRFLTVNCLANFTDVSC